MTAECNDNWSRLNTQPPPADWSTVTGGAFRGPVGGGIAVPAGRINVLSDLTIISEGDLTIEGNIEFGQQPNLPPFNLLPLLPPPASPNITLVSVKGKLTKRTGDMPNALPASANPVSLTVAMHNRSR
jgi:hypothetical protein